MRRCFLLDRCLTLCLFVIVAAVCGCASQTPKRFPESPGSVLNRLSLSIAEDEQITATAHLDVMTQQGHYPVRAAIIFQKPSYFRLEVLPLIGTPDFFLAATPESMNIFIPSRGEFYAGKPSLCNISQFIPWVLTIEEMVMILSGSPPPLPGHRLSQSREAGDPESDVIMKIPGGESQSLRFDVEGRLAGLIRSDAGGQPVYSVLYDDYGRFGRLASKITIRKADQTLALSVTLTTVKIEKTMDRSIFELRPPAGIRVVQLD